MDWDNLAIDYDIEVCKGPGEFWAFRSRVGLMKAYIDKWGEKKKAAPKFAEVTFSADIHCNSCKDKVDAALPYIKGVKDFKVSVEERTVWFKYDASKVTKQKLGAELAELGFPAKEIVKEEKK